MKKDVVKRKRIGPGDALRELEERVVSLEHEMKCGPSCQHTINLEGRVARLEDIIYQIAAQNGNVIVEPLPSGD